jgi:hypothetical protein
MSEQSNPKASPYAIVTGLVAGGLTAYFMFDYSGPYQWISEAQLSILGLYSQKLAFLLTFIALWAAVAVIMLPLRVVLSGSRSAPPPWATAPASAGTNVPPAGSPPATAYAAPTAAPGSVPLAPRKWQSSRLGDFGLALLLMGVIFCFLGGRDYLRASAAGGQIQPATAAQFELGKPPTSTWVRVTGTPLLDATVSYGTGSSPDEYVPLASTADAVPQNGVRLFAKFGPKTAANGQIDGLVTKNDLPGPVRVRMEEAGLLKPGDHWMIEVGKDPARTQSTAKIFAMIGGGMALLGLVMNVGRVRQWASR